MEDDEGLFFDHGCPGSFVGTKMGKGHPICTICTYNDMFLINNIHPGCQDHECPATYHACNDLCFIYFTTSVVLNCIYFSNSVVLNCNYRYMFGGATPCSANAH